MNSEEINNKEIEKFEKISNTTHAIENLYKKLAQLEIDGKHGSPEYLKLLDYLKIALDTETELYKKLNEQDIEDMGKYIITDKTPEMFLNNINCLTENKNDGNAERRMLDFLLYEMKTNRNLLVTHYSKDLMDVLARIIAEKIVKGEDLKKVNPKDIENEVVKRIELRLEFERDYFNTFLLILNSYINNPTFSKYKNDLIACKYNALLINPRTEADLLKTNFNIPDENFLYSGLCAEIKGIDEERYDILKDDYYKDEVLSQIIITLTECKDNLCRLLHKCSIKAFLILITDSLAEEINDMYHELLNDDSYIEKYPNNMLNERAIEHSFKAIKENKKKIKKLSINN